MDEGGQDMYKVLIRNLWLALEILFLIITFIISAFIVYCLIIIIIAAIQNKSRLKELEKNEKKKKTAEKSSKGNCY